MNGDSRWRVNVQYESSAHQYVIKTGQRICISTNHSSERPIIQENPVKQYQKHYERHRSQSNYYHTLAQKRESVIRATKQISEKSQTFNHLPRQNDLTQTDIQNYAVHNDQQNSITFSNQWFLIPIFHELVYLTFLLQFFDSSIRLQPTFLNQFYENT